MAFFHRVENLALRWKILEHLCGISSMLDALLTIFEFLLGFEILIHVYDPMRQEFIIHRSKLLTYHRHYETSSTFELLHIMSVDGKPGGFHPVLPRSITNLKFFGMERFHEVLEFSRRDMSNYRELCPVNWDECIDFKHLNPPRSFLKPISGIAAEPDDYHFQDLDQNTSWKDFDVLCDDIRKGDLYLEAYHIHHPVHFDPGVSSCVLESPSFADSSDDDGFFPNIPQGCFPSSNKKIYSDPLGRPLGPLMSLIAACSDPSLIQDEDMQKEIN